MSTPITALDHLRIAVDDLDADSASYTILLGRTPRWQGVVDGRRAALFATDNVHLLLLETRGQRGLEGVCFRVDALERLRRRLQRVGLEIADAPDPIASAAGASEPAGLVELPASQCRGLPLSFTARDPATDAQEVREATMVSGLDHIVIASGNAQATAFMLAAQLGLDMRMDIQRPQWDARLMFFRCGDLIVEVFQQLSGDTSSEEDSFYGLSWRVADADLARTALEAHDFEVSEVRKGHRPGTRVLTVRNRTAGVDTLLIEHTQP